MLKFIIYVNVLLLSLSLIYSIDNMYETSISVEARGGQVSNVNMNLNIQSSKWDSFQGESEGSYILVSFSNDIDLLKLEGVKDLKEFDTLYSNTLLKNDLPSEVFSNENEIFNEYTMTTRVKGLKQGVLKQIDKNGITSYVLIGEVVDSKYSMLIPKDNENLNFYEVY